ncbi:uncharacterized protein LKV04_008431 [Tautogolabrus adspersus]
MSDVAVINQLRTILRNISYPLSINDQIQISDVNISTVCSASSHGVQCRCEDRHRWSCDQCVLYGSCDNITDDTCGCINAIPPDGQYCKSVDLHTLPVVNEYLISVELNMSDVAVINQLRTILRNISYPLSINDQIQISDVNISTVCSASSHGVQCRCEDRHRWSCDQCVLYGSCDNITDDTCGCINAIPPDGQYCKSVDLHSFTWCPNATSSPSPSNSTAVVTTVVHTTSTPTTETALPVVNEYLISVELNMSDVAVINQLRTILRNISYPLSINDQIQISDVNISTVCSASSHGVQCRCEDRHRWSCDQCVLYGSCDNITDDTSGCINAIPPDGQYCKSVDLHSFTWCPIATSSPSPSNSTPSASTHLNTAVLTMSPTINALPVVNEYLISVELNMSDVAVINQLRTILRNISYPLSINDQTQISDVNISTGRANSFCYLIYLILSIIHMRRTYLHYIMSLKNDTLTMCWSPVCSASSHGVQCRCEDRHRWSCDQCVLYGSCDNITDDTCGCINAIPPDGRYCKSVDLHSKLFEHESSDRDVFLSNLFSYSSLCTLPSFPPDRLLMVFIAFGLNTSDQHNTDSVINYYHGVQCRCEDRHRWSCDQCVLYGSCDNITDDTCGCINAIPPDGQYCKSVDLHSFTWCPNATSSPSPSNSTPSDSTHLNTAVPTMSPTINALPVVNEYLISVELNMSDVAVINQLRTILRNISYPLSINDQIQISDVNISTVCSASSHGVQCRCEDRHRWSCDQCVLYGSCDNITDDTCGCINAIPPDGRYCKSVDLHNFTWCPNATSSPSPSNSTPSASTHLNTAVPTMSPTINGTRIYLDVVSTTSISHPFFVSKMYTDSTVNEESYCIVHHYQLGRCSETQQKEIQFMCKVDKPKGYQLTTTMTIFRDDVKCDDAQYGAGRGGDISSIGCGQGQEGRRSAVCQETGEWRLNEDSCIITPIKELLMYSQDLVLEEVPQLVANLSDAVQGAKTETANSSATISAIIEIISIIANVTIVVSESGMEKILETVDVVIGDDSRDSWAFLNANTTRNASSELLGSLETLSNGLIGEFAIKTERILLNRTTFNNSFRTDLNSGIVLEIPNTGINNVFITTITFPTLNNVIPARNSSFEAIHFNASNDSVVAYAINAAVVLVQINETIQNVFLSFEKLNNSLSLNPQCVFWNFTLFHNLGAWDDDGCKLVSYINNKVNCSCNHLTSFSILMATDIPPELIEALDIITYVGVGISLASLGICLIIEGYVWKAITRNNTSFMRHVSIINTALSLMIADICFIIGASIAKTPLENSGKDYEVPFGPCSTVTFFTHLFYLALFFWMLVSGLLLFYRIVMVFSHMSKSTMLAISFSLGYGCPLIIAVTTVAVTGQGHGYIRRYNACWLNWMETKALLALVVPALTIVFINILIVIVVLFKMLRRGVGNTAQTEEKHTLMVIARCIVILTPLFGLTWSLGVGTVVSSTNKGIQIAFAFFNSLQGFFILVFGTLFDSKIRSILSRKLPTSTTGSDQTRC